MTIQDTIISLTDNRIELPKDKEFTAILGANPSKGARSPILWNAAFKAYNLPIRMYPLDVTPKNLNQLLNALSSLPTFLGGAIAVPHKSAVSDFLCNSITESSIKIGAVNCLFRNEEGALVGTNTDGEGALIALKKSTTSLAEKTILILGAGGSAKAVAAYMLKEVGKDGNIIVACRATDQASFMENVLGARVIKWELIPSFLSKVDVIINCTTIGTGRQISDSPIDEKNLRLVKNNTFVYDINYDPKTTNLISLSKDIGLPTLNGLSMNMEQAVLAFKYAMQNIKKDLDTDMIRKSMTSI